MSMDPKPQPPVEPAPEQCCRSGCNPCVYDLYDEEMAQYREQLALWEARQAQATPGT